MIISKNWQSRDTILGDLRLDIKENAFEREEKGGSREL